MSEPSYHDYLFDYHFAGCTWSITIRATSPKEARQRIEAMAREVVYVGELYAEIPVPFGGPLRRLWQAMRGRATK